MPDDKLSDSTSDLELPLVPTVGLDSCACFGDCVGEVNVCPESNVGSEAQPTTTMSGNNKNDKSKYLHTSISNLVCATRVEHADQEMKSLLQNVGLLTVLHYHLKLRRWLAKGFKCSLYVFQWQETSIRN